MIRLESGGGKTIQIVFVCADCGRTLPINLHAPFTPEYIVDDILADLCLPCFIERYGVQGLRGNK